MVAVIKAKGDDKKVSLVMFEGDSLDVQCHPSLLWDTLSALVIYWISVSLGKVEC